MLWQTPSSIPLTFKNAEEKYYIPAKGFEYLCTHAPVELLIVSPVNERTRQGQVSGTPKNKHSKRLDLFGRKIYSTASLQFRVSNHQDRILLDRYNFNLWDSLSKFREALPQDCAQEFAALVEEGKAVAKGALQMTRDAIYSATRVVASAVVMRCSSWLKSSGLSQEMQSTLRDHPFEGAGLFS
ncbi:hypothetical protein UY3_15942 [Chelonia mydas]|uniref:Uncharacterized protein n=1 Tax=Chelonia mydas TaxID=8469 RepID=M7BFG1_CHEMY|nr:hypothetical protein UY3_15942 [Chelonia mydas]